MPDLASVLSIRVMPEGLQSFFFRYKGEGLVCLSVGSWECEPMGGIDW